MNYRHAFHAGNFADVLKHALLVQLVRAMQVKAKGFLYLDTHAGRGAYDLTLAAHGDSLARRPEHPDGIGRLWALAPETLPAPVRDYVDEVRRWDRQRGNLTPDLRFYPGSPALVELLARSQDRLALVERQPDEAAALGLVLPHRRGVSVQALDGYTAVRAMLPPPERRALVLIDPPFEAQDEARQVAGALREGLQRLPAATFAVWYPLTERARTDALFAALRTIELPPCWTAELAVAGEGEGLKMRGCGVLVLNPPWQLDRAVTPWLPWLAEVLAQAPGAGAALQWLVPER